MKCIICSSNMSYHFSKVFNEYELGKVDYHVCTNCGFGASKTHFEMTQEVWEKLNVDWHNDNNDREDNPYNRNQRYFQQALMISILKSFGAIDGEFVDWGSGVGSVSKLAQKFFNIELLNYDEYITPHLLPVDKSLMQKRHFDLVTSNAVFEHVLSRETLDDIESNVKNGGCLAVHTLIGETVPKDPEWMYLLHVHSAFHTNKSMDILMEQWGYKCSAYNEHSKMWMLFKRDYNEMKPIFEDINSALGWNYLKHKAGFMDYWK